MTFHAFQPGDRVRYAHGDTVHIVTVLGGHLNPEPEFNRFVSYTVALDEPGRPLWTMRIPANLLTQIKE